MCATPFSLNGERVCPDRGDREGASGVTVYSPIGMDCRGFYGLKEFFKEVFGEGILMSEQGTRRADEANEYLQKEGSVRIRGLRDEVENLKELLRLHSSAGKKLKVQVQGYAKGAEAA